MCGVGVNVEVHADHFLPDAPETEWLPEVSRRGWLILTKDDEIGRNFLEQMAIASSDAKVFVLSLRNLTGKKWQTYLYRLLNGWRSLPKVIKHHSLPKSTNMAKLGFGKITPNY